MCLMNTFFFHWPFFTGISPGPSFKWLYNMIRFFLVASSLPFCVVAFIHIWSTPSNFCKDVQSICVKLPSSIVEVKMILPAVRSEINTIIKISISKQSVSMFDFKSRSTGSSSSASKSASNRTQPLPVFGKLTRTTDPKNVNEESLIG